MNTSSPPGLDLAVHYLRSALTVTNANRRVFDRGLATRDEIVTTGRLILILRGELCYTVEDRTLTMRAGTEFFVPAWVRRVWSVPRGGPCEIIWCEFDEQGEGREWNGFVRRRLDPGEIGREKTAFGRVLRGFRSSDSAWSRLQLEAELKAMLVRFFERAKIPSGDPAMPVHPRIKASLRWLQANFTRRDALAELYRQAGLTPNYFRARFAEATQCSPHEYIERLRLRHARYLLVSTDWQLKRIAAEVGYDDPLYFSRLYRRFWNHAPRTERTISAASGG
jgi:Transcriptional regulator containing an amidase domain and an AraC-type DNA-binding HTH domain